MFRPLIRLGLWSGLAVAVAAADWPQFRGPGGRSVAEGPPPPTRFGPDSNVVWQVELPPGNSSPILVRDLIFLTGVASNHLETWALDRTTGATRWRATVPTERLEPTHRLGNPATPTPCSDGERVYVRSGSFGLLVYDFKGHELWRQALPTPVVEFGNSASPILVGDRLIQVVDQDQDSFLLALDSKTGHELWRTARPEFRRGFATPLAWTHDGFTELVVPGSVVLTAYDPTNGRERWRYTGTSRVSTGSPAVGEGLLFNASWNLGGDAGSRVSMPPFAEFIREHDTDKDGVLLKSEIPTGPIAERFSQMDFNKDGKINEAEWTAMAALFNQAENAVLALRPGGLGSLGTNALAWRSTRSLPYVSSPLYYQGRLFTMKSGGLASAYEARTGKILFQDERVGVDGDYYASAVAGGDNLYLPAESGTVVVLGATDRLEVRARNHLGEAIMATPAIADGQIFIRTAGHLYNFGIDPQR